MKPFNKLRKSKRIQPEIQVDSSRFSQDPRFVIPYNPISTWMKQEIDEIDNQLKSMDANSIGGDLEPIEYIGKLANTAYLAGRKDALNSLAEVVLKSVTQQPKNPSS